MILALDVYYTTTTEKETAKETAKSVAVVFEWSDEKPKMVYQTPITDVAAYALGEFYKRELPCLMAVLATIDLDTITTIIVDGHVYINNERKYGLGGYLWDALDHKIPIIGVAKRAFHATDAVTTEITRGESHTPLYISAIGIDEALAAEHIRTMHGSYRIPTILKILDGITRIS